MLLAALLLLSSVRAEPSGREEIDVYNRSSVESARKALDERLLAQGYRRKRSHGGYTVYRKQGAGEPVLFVYDDGWVRVRAQPIAPPKVVAQAPTGDQSGGSFTLQFGFSGPRVGGGKTARVLTAIQPELRELNNAVAAAAMDLRESYDIPAELEAIWSRPTPAAARRAALLAWWDERTETPEGERARRAAERFITAVVQTSGEGFTRGEIEEFNRHRQSERALVVRFLE